MKNFSSDEYYFYCKGFNFGSPACGMREKGSFFLGNVGTAVPKVRRFLF